ncbi:MAG: beta-propeller fold lactonase family protein [Chloroflexota bacterium]
MLLFFLVACNLPPPVVSTPRRPGEGTFVLFLNGPAKTPFSLAFDITAMEVVRADGARRPILNQSRSIDSLKLVERQILLSESFLPPGRYRQIHVAAAKAQLNRSGQHIDLSVAPEGFTFDVDFEIRANEATPLFMSWNVEDSIERQAFLRPAFAFVGRGNELRGVLAYVTNENSNMVTIIDRSLDRVVDVLEVGQQPKGIVVAQNSSRAYIVNSGSNNLTILDIKTNTVLHTANIESAANPTEIAIHPNGRILYIANTALNSVSVIDATSFQTIDLIPVDRQPVALAVDPTGTKLLVANMGANTVSVIDTARNRVTATIPVEFQPVSVSMDTDGSRAFVTHLRSQRTALIALSTLRATGRMNTGPATYVLPDVASRRVFVTQLSGNRLGFFDPNIDAEVGSVPVGAEPNRLAFDVDREKIYVVNRGSDSITVVDRISRVVKTEIPTTKRPFGIAIVR